MKQVTDTAAEQQAAFEMLMQRPRDYFRLSVERQWEIDRSLGVLDVEVDERYITEEMKRRWKTHFWRR